ncbi:MAG: tRNA (adenosine(37)-N6)-threonylcarbamoyltransferase complex dimerization subunit type 1 TsaB [Clostridiales bacterium]|nr:tRNA (adenosine(37)-N6)-threonylcarbamoyltransferase complex dimerization subunit type 1 TsaB [Clostridiales bacterium]
MKILAVDTSAFPASAAVTDGEYILGEYVIRNQRKHSQNIMPMVDSLLDGLGMDISEIDVFAVTVGPGSFTGLRIGISTVRAFAQAMGKPVVGISTLEALAYNFAGACVTVVPMLDARRDEVFTAAYNGGETILKPCVMTVGEAAELFADSGAIYTGDGAVKHREEILAADPTAVIASPNLCEVRASAAAAAAYKKAENGEGVNYNEIQPVYLRKSQAEREYDNKTKGNDNK